MSLFDAYLCIDWSGRNSPSPVKPSRDALWIGERHSDGAAGERYYRTREACVRDLRDRLQAHAAAGRRVLVGFDFPFGYPKGLVSALELEGPGPPWLRLWRELDRRISDAALNASNRLAVAGELNERCRRFDGEAPPGPFWGCPQGKSVSGLAPRSPGFPFPARGDRILPRLRSVDRRCPGIQEGWKLYGAGSVGSQALLGIPRVLRLREDPELSTFSYVWPFEEGSRTAWGAGPVIVYAEVWPSRHCANPADPAEPRDRAQVRAVAAWMAEQDSRGELEGWLALPADLSPEERAVVLHAEGWILGVE